MNAAPIPPRKYTWPWFVLAGVVLFFLISILWVFREANRIKRQRIPTPRPTNAALPNPAKNPQVIADLF